MEVPAFAGMTLVMVGLFGLNSLKPILPPVLSHLPRVPNTTIHRDPDTWLQRLNRTDGTADVENRI